MQAPFKIEFAKLFVWPGEKISAARYSACLIIISLAAARSTTQALAGGMRQNPKDADGKPFPVAANPGLHGNRATVCGIAITIVL